MQPASLKKTPLNQTHRATKAKMVDFGGWDMPVQYSGLVEEHNAVRSRSACSMSAIWARSKFAARRRSNWWITSPLTRSAKLKTGQAHYSGLLYEHGGFVDDILVHKVADDHYFLCVNASNQEKDFEHIEAQNKFELRGGVCERQLCADCDPGPECTGHAAEADR